jgi:hypothetical protein
MLVAGLIALTGANGASAGGSPRILYLCDNCDQYQMAYTEDFLTQSAKKEGVGVIKLGTASKYAGYDAYLKSHPGSGAGGLTRLNSVKIPYNTSTFPKDEKEAAERRKQFAASKKAWADQLLTQFKRLDKTKPLVLHFGNHGINPDGKSAGSSSAFCMASSITSISQCLTYDEIGVMLTDAGLTGQNAPPIRIIGDHCFGGGVHALSMKFPNICSASSVSFKQAQSSPNMEVGSENGIYTFGQNFWKTVLQEGGSGTSLANSYQVAWSAVPKDDSPGGTLSSIFYAQQLMKWPEEVLPTHERLPSLTGMEKSINAVNSLYMRTQSDLNEGRGYESFGKPEYVCRMPGQEISKSIAQLEGLLKTLTLDSGANIYREAVNRAKDSKFHTNGKAAVAAINGCWSDAKSKYDSAPQKVKDFIDRNGNWAWKNVLRSGKKVRDENRDFRRNQEMELANQVLKNLEKCLHERQPPAREYLTSLQTLNTLENLSTFAGKASPAQKSNFRKKVECESAPLL